MRYIRQVLDKYSSVEPQVYREYLHVSERRRSWRREGDEAREVGKHAETDTFGTDGGREDFRAPDKGRSIDELEKYDEQEDDGDCCTESCLICPAQVFVLEHRFQE